MKKATSLITKIAFLAVLIMISTAATAGELLLVIDNGNADGETWLEATLNSEDSLFDVMHIKVDGPPSYQKMTRYRTVIWYSEGYNSSFFFSSSKNDVRRYLESGGSLLLCGSGMGNALDEGPFGSITAEIFGLKYHSTSMVHRMDTVFGHNIPSSWNYRYGGRSDLYKPVSQQSGNSSFIEHSPFFSTERFGEKYITAATAHRRSYPPYYRAALIGFEPARLESGDEILMNTLNWLKPTSRELVAMLNDVRSLLKSTRDRSNHRFIIKTLDYAETLELQIASMMVSSQVARDEVTDAADELELNIDSIQRIVTESLHGMAMQGNDLISPLQH